MIRFVFLCFVLSFQFASLVSEPSIFQQTGNILAPVLDIFENKFALLFNDESYRSGKDSFDQTNDEICLQQLNSTMSGLRNSESWAMKLIDAWGKIPSGILYGNTYELGQFDECLSVERAANDQDTNILKGQYCVTQLNIISGAQTFDENADKRQLKKENNVTATGVRLMPSQGAGSLGLNVGICVPDSCSPERITEILNYALNVLNVSAMALVSADFCHTNIKADLSTLDIFTITFFGIIVFLMAASTIYDVLMTQNKKNKRICLTAFSVYSNAQKIFHCKENSCQDAIDCLNGIRVLSIVWVMFGHAHMIFAMGPLLNPAYIIQWIKQLYSMLLITATVSVDSFFLLSGLLVAWSTLRHLDKSKGKLNIFLFYFHRYIRLTPSLAALVLLSSSLIRQVGSGPLWKIFLSAADKPCQEYWWSTLLYVQNYVSPSKMCLGHSWYLAVDTQLFILSPLIVYPLWRWRRKFVWIIPILISLSMGCVFSIFMIFHYSAQAMTQMTGGGSMIKTYYPTHTRMGAWLVGVLLGYTLHNLKGKTIRLPKILIAIGWLIAVGTILSIIFGPYYMQQPDYKATDLESAFYESFSRVCWAISLSWIIFACVHGYGGPVNWFLSLRQWQPLARLSYSIYLVHLPIQLLIAGSSRTELNFTDYTALHKFWGDFGLTLTVSLFWTLAFESPVVVFEKIMFSKRTEAVTVSNEHLVRSINFNSSETIGSTEILSSQPSPSKV